MNLQKEKIDRLYFKFLLPSLGSAMVMSIYTMTDAIVIGKGVGSDALGALNIVTPLLCILMSMGILFGVGGSVHMNVHRGTGNIPKANRYFTISFASLGLVTLLIGLIYGMFMQEILVLMGANKVLYPYAMEYMGYFNKFLPVAVFSNFIAIFVRADNDPNRAMLGVILGGVVNIILDILFVFPMKMGIGGAAFASCLGMCVQVLIAGSHFVSQKNQLHFIAPRHIGSSFAQIVGSGISAFFNELANGVIVFLFNIQILKYCGSNALSVYSVIANCVILFNSLFTGVGQSVQPIIANNYGAGLMERIAKVKKLGYYTVFIMGGIFTLVGGLFPHEICRIFIHESTEISDIAGYAIRVYFLTFLPMGVNLFTSYYLQSILKTKEALVISVLRNLVLSGVLILTAPMLFGGNVLWGVMVTVELVVLAGYMILNGVLQKK